MPADRILPPMEGYGPKPTTTDDIDKALHEVLSSDPTQLINDLLAGDLSTGDSEQPTNDPLTDYPEIISHDQGWQPYSERLRAQTEELKNEYRNPLSATNQVSFPLIQDIVDGFVRKLYDKLIDEGLKGLIAPPDNLNTRGFFSSLRKPDAVLGNVFEKRSKSLQDLHELLLVKQVKEGRVIPIGVLIERFYLSTNRSDTFARLVDYADLEPGKDCFRMEADVYGKGNDNFRFFLTLSGFEKVEAVAGVDGRQNLRSIESQQEQGDGSVCDTFFTLYGSKEKLLETMYGQKGGFVIGCFYRGVFRQSQSPGNNQNELDHIWEVEGRHLAPDAMLALLSFIRQAIRQLHPYVNPVYVSPKDMISYVPRALEVAFGMGVADTLQASSEALNKAAERALIEARQADDYRNRLVSALGEGSVGRLVIPDGPRGELSQGQNRKDLGK